MCWMKDSMCGRRYEDVFDLKEYLEGVDRIADLKKMIECKPQEMYILFSYSENNLN